MQVLSPTDFLILVLCLAYVTARRIIADDRKLISLTKEMRAATRIQKTILLRRHSCLENATIVVRYAPMADVGGELQDHPCDLMTAYRYSEICQMAANRH